MERAEAEAVYEQGRETVVAVLLELSAQNALLRREVAELSEANRRLEIRVADLEERLNRNSRNSSTPPSQDPPGVPERRRAPTSEPSQGAQPGHPGRGRHLLPIASLDELIEHWPARCRCGHVFCTAPREALGEPVRHQVAELPPTAVILSEHRLQRLRCPQCGAVTRAELEGFVYPDSRCRAVILMDQPAQSIDADDCAITPAQGGFGLRRRSRVRVAWLMVTARVYK